MKVTITCRAQPKRYVTIDSNTLFYEKATNTFWMTRPRGDDWLQQVRSDFSFLPASIESTNMEMTVSFDTIEAAQEFERWLIYANREADEGYRTMRG